jgi:hypothetical protein
MIDLRRLFAALGLEREEALAGTATRRRAHKKRRNACNIATFIARTKSGVR